jgi:mercuric ion binding protein
MNIKIIFLALSLLAGFFSMSAIYAKSSVQVQNSSQSVTLDVQNMTCAMCKFTIKKALQGVDGVRKVTVDYDNKTAGVKFDPTKTNKEALIKATTNAGYPATIQQAEK